MITALLVIAFAVVWLFLWDILTTPSMTKQFHYLPATTISDGNGRQRAACGAYVLLSEVSLAPDCPACEDYLRRQTRSARADLLASWTHATRYDTPAYRDGRKLALCGYIVPKAKQSPSPSCPECQAQLARDNAESIEDRFGPEPPYTPLSTDPFDPLADYTPKKR